MKQVLRLSLLSFITASCLWLSSCKKDSSSPTPNPTPAPTASSAFTANIDGVAWTSTTTGSTYRNGVFVLSGKSSDGKSIILRLAPMAGYETLTPYYMYSSSTDNVGVFMESAADSLAYTTNQYESRSMTENVVTFSSFNLTTKKVSGTFTMKVQRLIDNKIKTITGTFTDVVYDDKIPPTPTKTMTAKVNGASWAATSVIGYYSSMTSSVAVTANAANGSTIGLNIPISATTGQTLTPSAFGSVRAQYNPNTSSFKAADVGTIQITYMIRMLK